MRASFLPEIYLSIYLSSAKNLKLPIYRSARWGDPPTPMLVCLAACPGFSPRAPAPRLSLSVGAELGRGNYGVVHAATLEGKPVVAKRAGEDALAASYLDVEAAVNAELAGNSEPTVGFCTYLGEEQAQGSRWLVWERIGGEGGEATSLADLIAAATPPQTAAAALEEATGLTLAGSLRALLLCAQQLHGLGFVHRDFKPDNVLLDPAHLSGAQRLRLIDMGSCAMVEGCSMFDSLRGACTGYDLSRSPCSPLFAAPEAFVSPSDPFALCPRYSLGLMRDREEEVTEEKMKTNRMKARGTEGEPRTREPYNKHQIQR